MEIVEAGSIQLDKPQIVEAGSISLDTAPDLSLFPDQKKAEGALSMAATLDIPPSQAYRNHDIIKKGMEDKGLGKVAGKAFMSGIGDVYDTAGSALKWMGIDDQVYGDFGKRLKRAYSYEMKPEEFTWRKVAEPEWWATSVTRAVPFTLSLMPAAILAAYAGAGTATAVGLGAFGRLVMGAIGGAVVARPLESALEAGGTYQQEIDKGKSEAEAEEAANFVFKHNLTLTGMDVAEFATAFTPLRMLGKSATKSLMRRILATGGKLGVVGGMEAGEEGYQDIIQRLGVGDEVKFDPSMKEAMTIGGIFGVGMAGTGSVYTALRDRITKDMPPDTKKELDKIISTSLAEGMSQQNAELRALDKIAETPEGEEHIKKVVEELKDPTTIPKEEIKVAPEVRVEEAIKAVESRGVKGDDLLDVSDRIEEARSYDKTIEIDKEGYVTLYHRTTEVNASNIKKTGYMTTKEPGLFFGSKPEGQIEGYGDAVVKVRVPIEKVEINDIFTNEVHFSLPEAMPGKTYTIEVVTPEVREGVKEGRYEEYQRLSSDTTTNYMKIGEVKVFKVTEAELPRGVKLPDGQKALAFTNGKDIFIIKNLTERKFKEAINHELVHLGMKDSLSFYEEYPDLKPVEVAEEIDTTFEFGKNVPEIPVSEISTDFKDHAEGYLSGLLDMVKMGEPGKRVTIEGVEVTEDTVPEFMRGKGWTQKRVITVLEKAIEGKKLTEKEQEILVAALEQAETMFWRDAESMGIVVEDVSIEAAFVEILAQAGISKAKAKEITTRLKETRKALKQKKIPAKKQIRIATGQVKVGDVIEIKEIDALNLAMKKAAQAARKAYSAGDKAGVAKAKAHFQVIAERAKERKALRERIKKLTKQIAKEPGASIDFFYREAIENLQAGIDPSFRTEKTLKSRERTREFLAKYPEKTEDMPTKLLKLLNKTTLNDLTINELEEIAEKISDLRKIGKLKRELKLGLETRQHDKNVEQIVAGINNNEPVDIEKQPVVFSTTREGKIKKIVKSARAMTLTPSRIFDLFDGAKAVFGEITHKLFYDAVNVKVNDSLRQTDRRFDTGTAKREELNITLENLNQTREIDGVVYRVDEMVGIYCAEKNPSSKLAIMYGNNLTEEAINKIIGNLTPQEKAWGDFIIKDYEENHGRLREEVIEVENRDLGHEENYTPIRRTGIDYKMTSQEILDEILMKNHFKKGYAEKGFTIDRKSIPAEFQKPIRLDVTGVWFDQVFKQEHYVHFAKLAKQLHRIVGDKRFAESVTETFGKEYLTATRHYVDRIANPSIYKAFSSLEKASRALRQNMVIAYLSGNIVTIGKQLPSAFFYLRDATPKYLFGAMAKFATNPMTIIDFVKSKDPQMKHRMIEREMEELKNLQRNAYDSIIRKVGKIGMKGIYMMDRVATTIGWMGVYDRALAEGKSEAEAIRLAQNATLRTQPAAHAKDIAELYATNEFLNWFTQFTNQLNKIYNITTYDIPADVKAKNYYNALLSSISMAMGALMIWVMAHRRLPEDAEDVKDAFKEQAINAIPLFGKAISAGTSGWKGSNIPVMKSAEALGVLMSDTSSKAKKRAIIEAICVTLGIPYTGTRRIVKAITKEDARELIGGKPRD